MALSRHERTRRKADLNPLEMIERVIADNDWPFDRTSDREIAVEVAGRWCDYRMFFSWRDDVEALHFTCAYDVRIPAERHNEIHVLLALINEKMWLGHFDLWTEEGLPMFRHAIPLRGTSGLMPDQLNDLVEVAITESERFYPAFQYVVWAGKSPADALTASILETVGEACTGTLRRPLSQNQQKSLFGSSPRRRPPQAGAVSILRSSLPGYNPLTP